MDDNPQLANLPLGRWSSNAALFVSAAAGISGAERA
jgi:hypothetical protein